MTIKIPPKRRGRRAIPEVKVVNPGKGLNNLISDSLIKDEEASDLNNIAFVESGAVSKRTGYTQLGNTLSNNPKGLGVLYTTTLRHLVTIDGTSLKYLNGSTWTAVSGASFTASSETNFSQASQKLFIWNGTDGGAYYDGSTVTRPGTIPRAKFGIYYNGYHICSGVDTQPNRIYVANTTDVTDFTDATDDSTSHPGATVFAGSEAAKYADVNAGDGDKVTGLAKFQNVLIIFKERSIYQATFDSSGTPTISLVSATNGCVGHKSIESVENDVFFLTKGGFYVLGNEPNYYNVVRTNELSSRISTTLDTITESNAIKVASLYSDFKFYSSIPSGGTTTNNLTVTYDRRFLAWSLTDNINANAWTEFVDSNSTKHIYFAADDAAKIYELNENYNDNGSAIDAYWASKAFDMGVYQKKFFIDVTLLFRQVVGSVVITIILDGEDIAETVTLSSTLEGGIGTEMLGEAWMGGTPDTDSTTNSTMNTNNIPYRIPINKYARTIKIKVANSTVNQTFTLLSFSTAYRMGSHYNFDSENILQ